jgi:hypothetical protein
LIQLPISDTITIANKGDKVYVNDVTDNSTFTITSSAGNPQATIGNIEKFISANLARVRIKTQFVVANGA